MVSSDISSVHKMNGPFPGLLEFLVHARNFGVLRDPLPFELDPFEGVLPKQSVDLKYFGHIINKHCVFAFSASSCGWFQSGALHARNYGVLRSNAPLYWLCQQSYSHQTKLGTTSHYHVNITFWILHMADWLHIYLILMWVISSIDLARISPTVTNT